MARPEKQVEKKEEKSVEVKSTSEVGYEVSMGKGKPAVVDPKSK